MLTFIYSYFDNPGMLELHLETWKKYEDSVKEKLSIIIVDDCSQKYPAFPILNSKVTGIFTRLYRVKVNIPWNLDGARNLAMKETATDWNLMTDMDRLVPEDSAIAALTMVTVQGNYYRPNQVWMNGPSLKRPHPNSFIIHRSDFWACGGYDEDFAGSYGTDGNFRKNLNAVAKEVYVENPYFICCEQVVGDAITQGLPRKDKGSYCLSIDHLRKKVMSKPYRAIDPVRFPWERLL